MSISANSVAVAERPMATRREISQRENGNGPARPASEMLDMCIANLDPGLRVLEANGEFLKHLGRTAGEVYGQSFGDFVHPSVKRLMLHCLARLSEGKRDRFSARLVGVRPGDTIFSGALTGIAVRDHSGEVKRIVIMVKPDHVYETSFSATDQKKVLSELDARVLEGVAAGVSTAKLATMLYLSRQGIEYHVGAMLRRFKVPSRSALASKAYSQGILCIGQWPPKVSPEYIR